jgi:hypothetical protein
VELKRQMHSTGQAKEEKRENYIIKDPNALKKEVISNQMIRKKNERTIKEVEKQKYTK